MRTVRCPASTWWASARPAVNVSGRRRSALLVTLNRSWWQQAPGDFYALTGLAALTQAAIKKLLPRPKRRDPGTAGTLAAPHDQELRPVPSQTRDDASVPART
jgi:hypothetical protein